MNYETERATTSRGEPEGWNHALPAPRVVTTVCGQHSPTARTLANDGHVVHQDDDESCGDLRPIRRREIYARAAVQLRTNERATRAERICPGAMGLYFFLLLQARGEETAGDVDVGVALASWGAPISFRRRQIAALGAVGLIEERGDRIVVARYAEHNDPPDVIARNREAAREKKAGQRERRRAPYLRAVEDSTPPESGVFRVSAPVVPGGHAGGHPGVSPFSDSGLSLFDLDPGRKTIADSERARAPGATPSAPPPEPPLTPPPHETGPTPEPDPTERVALDVAPPRPDAEDDTPPPPEWFTDAAVASVEMITGLVVDEPRARWLEYYASRRRKQWEMSHRDAVGWLANVLRTERSERARREARWGPGPRNVRQPLGDLAYLKRVPSGEAF